jgi:hypothetical protein
LFLVCLFLRRLLLLVSLSLLLVSLFFLGTLFGSTVLSSSGLADGFFYFGGFPLGFLVDCEVVGDSFVCWRWLVVGGLFVGPWPESLGRRLLFGMSCRLGCWLGS